MQDRRKFPIRVQRDVKREIPNHDLAPHRPQPPHIRQPHRIRATRAREIEFRDCCVLRLMGAARQKQSERQENNVRKAEEDCRTPKPSEYWMRSVGAKRPGLRQSSAAFACYRAWTLHASELPPA